MSYGATKVYFDGSHYIAIPRELQPWKKRKNINSQILKETQKEDKESKHIFFGEIWKKRFQTY